MNGVKTQPRPANPSDDAPTVSGKLVIIVVGFVAVGGALFSWWFRYNATHHAAALWGSRDSALIRDAEMVNFLQLRRLNGSQGLKTGSAPSFGEDVLHLDGIPFAILGRKDVSHAPGLTHLRNALLEDKSFVWPARTAHPEEDWAWALDSHFEKESA